MLWTEPRCTEHLPDLHPDFHSSQLYQLSFLHNSIQQKIKVFAGSKAKLFLLFKLVQPHKRINYFRTISFDVSFGFESGRYCTGEVPIELCDIFCLFFFNGTVMYHLAKHWQFLLIYLYHSFEQYLLI